MTTGGRLGYQSRFEIGRMKNMTGIMTGVTTALFKN
jgi:hypothetical protein